METKVKNREWVKNAAIIFLAVLLVLTFFSNTIMNRSLPEVATSYVQSDAITARIRGTGTVVSQGVYEVKAAETREVRAVMIKTGQKVETGDVLFVLGEGDSAEIEAAQEQLRQLKLNYQQTAAGSTNYGGKLQSAQARYDSAVAAEAAALEQMNENEEVKNMLKNLNTSKEILATVEREYQLSSDRALKSLSDLITAFQNFENACASAGIIDTLSLHTAQYELESARTSIAAADGSENSIIIAIDRIGSLSQPGENACGIIYSFVTSNQQEGIEYFPEYIAFDTLVKTVMNNLNDSDDISERLLDPSQAIYDGDLMDCTKAKKRAAETVNRLQAEYDYFSTTFSDEYTNAVAERQAAEAALKALRESADDYNRQAAITGISLKDLQYQIERAQEKLDSLTGGVENQITANVSGTVSAVSVTAGKTAAKDEILATIDVPDLGYTLSFSVTNDQARRLHPGDSADVTSYYWGSQIEATLASIKPDPKNPQTNKLLEFELKGETSAGAQLTVSVGERSQTYDLVVPNSSIRSDSNGKFVLIIQAKNSALGNRYFAKRVDVEIIAADDNNSAVTGALNYGDFVITTSSAPIKSGDQVRMAEG